MTRAALQLDGLAKRYGACVVLEGASLTLEAGAVRALVGENGAGKSTLLGCAAGLVAYDAGVVRVDGAALPAGDARLASARGVGVVHQHFKLVDTLTVAQNVVLGHEPRRGPLGLLVDHAAARSTVRALAERYALPVEPDALVGALSVGERQRVELLKVLHRGAKYVLLDEPTAVLSPTEVPALLAMVRALARGGAGVLLVSHKLDEVFAVAEAVTVLRRGRVVLETATSATSPSAVARAMVGDEHAAALEQRLRPAGAGGEAPSAGDEGAAPVLALAALRGHGLRGVSLEVRAGEVLGVAGVEGNGQRPLAQAVAGLLDEAGLEGSVTLEGASLRGLSVAARRARGLGFLPEDREVEGLFAELRVDENLALGGAHPWGTARERRARAEAVVRAYDVRPPEPAALVGALSGGNAQKVLAARELERPLRALVVSQPTRGVDLLAALRLRAALEAQRAKRVAVLLFSSELDELRALCDRVLVLRGGRVAGELPVAQATNEALGALMSGADAGAAEERSP